MFTTNAMQPAAQQRHPADALRAANCAALTSFAAWFGNALRAAEPGCFTCRGGRQACSSPSPAQVSAALGGRMISRVFYVGLMTIKGNEVRDGESTQETTENVDQLAS